MLATGYVMPDIVHSTIHAVSSSWAIATPPQPQNIWKDGALIWENSKKYLYARTTRAGRIIIGGEDSERGYRARGARSPDPGKIRASGAKARSALAACERRDRIPLGRHLRYHQRRPAADRSRPRRQGRLCRLWLWRQRDHLQLSRRATDRRPDRGFDLAAAARFRAGPGWRNGYRLRALVLRRETRERDPALGTIAHPAHFRGTRWTGVHSDEVYFRDTAHGFIAWAFASVLGAVLLASLASSLIGGAASGATQAATSAASQSGPMDGFIRRRCGSQSGRCRQARQRRRHPGQK